MFGCLPPVARRAVTEVLIAPEYLELRPVLAVIVGSVALFYGTDFGLNTRGPSTNRAG